MKTPAFCICENKGADQLLCRTWSETPKTGFLATRLTIHPLPAFLSFPAKRPGLEVRGWHDLREVPHRPVSAALQKTVREKYGDTTSIKQLEKNLTAREREITKRIRLRKCNETWPNGR